MEFRIPLMIIIIIILCYNDIAWSAIRLRRCQLYSFMAYHLNLSWNTFPVSISKFFPLQIPPLLNSSRIFMQLCAPVALFHAKKDGRFMPITIQLFQEPGENNPVGPIDSNFANKSIFNGRAMAPSDFALFYWSLLLPFLPAHHQW